MSISETGITGNTDDILATFSALYGDDTGYLHIAAGRDPYFSDKGKYKHHDRGEQVYEYPAEADRAAHTIAAHAATCDVYVCACLMRGRTRTKGAAVTHRMVHADVDTDTDLDRVRTVNGSAIASGTPGHAHVYVAVADDLSINEYQALCRGLVGFFGGDPGKICDNDVLRPAGTLNHKPTLTGGKPAPVTWLVKPTMDRREWDKHELAALLGVTLPPPYETNGGQASHESTVAAVEYAPLDLDNYPRVKAALDRDTDDRSADTARVVGACLDAGLTLPQTRTAVDTRANLVEKLAELKHDDVARLFEKFTDDRKSQDTADSDDVTHSGHLGMAIKLGKQFRNKLLLYVHNVGWHRWDGKRWAPDGDGAARRAVHTVIRREWIKCAKLPQQKRDKRAQQISRYETAGAITGILTEAAVLEAFSVTVDALDCDPWILNCTNGTLDLHTLQLRPASPADRITKVCRGAYHPDAAAPVWDAFLTQVLPDGAVRAFVQRLTGLALIGEVREHILPIFTGKGANGKGTFYKAVLYETHQRTCMKAMSVTTRSI